MVVSSIPGRRTIGRLVLGWVTVSEFEGGDALRLGSKGRHGVCDPSVRALETVTTMRYTNRRIYFTLLYFTLKAG